MKSEEIQIEFDKLNEKVIQEVIVLAKIVLKNCPALHEFVNCMGSYFFTAKTSSKAIKAGFAMDDDKEKFPIVHECMGENETILRDIEGYKEFEEFVTKWDDSFNITGEPMRFTLSGKVKTDW